MTAPEAVAHLCKELKADPGYFEGWQANIAMSFYDACINAGIKFPQLQELANKAAHNFLCQLMYKPNE